MVFLTKITSFAFFCFSFVIAESFISNNIPSRIPNSEQVKTSNGPGSRASRNPFSLQHIKRKHPKNNVDLSSVKWNEHNLLSSRSDDNVVTNTKLGNNQNKNPISKNAAIFLSASILCLVILYLKSDIFFSLIPKIKLILSGLKDKLISSLDYLNGLGNVGLVAYSLLLLLWEVTVGVTTPVETCAGMAFGVKRGIIANAIGKISGALVAFIIGRFLLYEWVSKKLDQKDSDGNSTSEIFNLIESSFESNPIGVALIWRFSPLPEFIKNFGLSAIPGLKIRHFFVAVLLHGFPFTCLWTVLGAETSMVLRGIGEPSKVLKVITSLVPPFGFIVSPTLVGLWIKSLKKKQVQNHQKEV